MSAWMIVVAVYAYAQVAFGTGAWMFDPREPNRGREIVHCTVLGILWPVWLPALLFMRALPRM